MARIRPCEPDVTESSIGWLAVTPKDHAYRIGVSAPSEAEARRRFVAAMAAWQELHDRAEAQDRMAG